MYGIETEENSRLANTASKIFSTPQLSMNQRGQTAWSMWVHRTDVDQFSNEYQSFEFVFEIGYGDFPFHSANLYLWRDGERILCTTREAVEAQLELIESYVGNPPEYAFQEELTEEQTLKVKEEVDAACKKYLDSVTWNEPWAAPVFELCVRKVIAIQEVVELSNACK